MDFIKLKNDLETAEGLDRYNVLNMVGARYKEVSIYHGGNSMYVDIYSSDDRFLLKLHGNSRGRYMYNRNPEEKYNFCVVECDKYINTQEELIIKQSNRIVIIDYKAKIVYDNIISDNINSIKEVFNNILIINCDSETLICDIHTGKVLTRTDIRLGKLASQSKNWSINRSEGLKFFKCKDLMLVASLDTDYIYDVIKDFRFLYHVKSVNQTRYKYQSCLYDVKIVTDEETYYARGNNLYTLQELLSLFGISIINKVTDENNITKYIVQSNAGTLGEMSEDYTQVKFGNNYIKSSIHDGTPLGKYTIDAISGRKIG